MLIDYFTKILRGDPDSYVALQQGHTSKVDSKSYSTLKHILNIVNNRKLPLTTLFSKPL